MTGPTVALGTPHVAVLTSPGKLWVDGVDVSGVVGSIANFDAKGPWTVGTLYGNTSNKAGAISLAGLAIYCDRLTASETLALEPYFNGMI